MLDVPRCGQCGSSVLIAFRADRADMKRCMNCDWIGEAEAKPLPAALQPPMARTGNGGMCPCPDHAAVERPRAKVYDWPAEAEAEAEIALAHRRIVQLEAEVARLKLELEEAWGSVPASND